MLCPNCGQQMPDHIKFCTSCGKELVSVAAAAPISAGIPSEGSFVDPAPQQPSFASEQPQQPSFAPGQPQQPSFAPEQPQQPSFAPGQPQQPSFAPGQPQQPSFAPGQPQQPSFAPGQPQQPPFAPPQTAQMPPYGQNYGAQPPYYQPQAPKKSKAGLIIGILGGVIVLAVLALIFLPMLLGGSKVKVNLNDYVSMYFDGENGSGEAYIDFDIERFEADFTGKIQYTDPTWGNEADAPYDFFYYVVDGHMVGDSGVSNGDTVELIWDIDESYLSYFNVDLVYKDMSFVVTGLK